MLRIILLFLPSVALSAHHETAQVNLNTVWTIIAAILVFLMQAGFAAVEIGLTRSKNALNIVMKNLMDFSVGSLIFFVFGFGLMFGSGNGWWGNPLESLDLLGKENTTYTFIMFQTVFAATAATIVSGAVAERTKFTSYLIYSVFITGLIYPVFGAWAWGGLFKGSGWLENLSTGAFVDFAGSTVVHSIGGWLALMGAWIIGPRKGKINAQGKMKAIPGHNLVLAAIGVFILWFGWFGFNAGSTTTGDLSIGRIMFVTNLAGAAGAIGSMILSWILFKKPDVSMSLNGALAGLVSITAGCYTLTPSASILVGFLGGLLVVVSIVFIDQKLKIDDPVGAISVHGVCGFWGTIACGLFNAEKVLGVGAGNTGLFYGGGFNQLISQFIGAGSALIWGLSTGFILFSLIKHTVGLRVNENEEYIGLDIEEHGMEAYYTSK